MAKDMHDCLNISCKLIGECHRFYKGSAPPCAKLVEEKPNILQQPQAVICPHCAGSGVIPYKRNPNTGHKCRHCSGKGKLTAVR